MKKTIKVKFAGFPQKINSAHTIKVDFINDNIILDALRKHYNVEISDDPDYLFCVSNVWALWGAKVWDYVNYRKDCVRCAWITENEKPDFNTYDYAISFFHSFSYEDRYMYLPASLFYKYSAKGYDMAAAKHLVSRDELKHMKTDFCSFVYSNSKASPKRKEFFGKLDQYKHIDSGGGYMNNIGYRVEDKILFESSHKFSIAFDNCENSIQEKIMDAFAAKTIPIYWGSEHITDLYNEKAFINCMAYDNFDDVIEKIKEIDNDDELYYKMISEPCLIQKGDSKSEYKRLEQFLINMIEKPKEQAMLRTEAVGQDKIEKMRTLGFKVQYYKFKTRYYIRRPFHYIKVFLNKIIKLDKERK